MKFTLFRLKKECRERIRILTIITSLVFINCRFLYATFIPENVDLQAVSSSPISTSYLVELTDLPPSKTLCHQMMVDVVSYLDVVSIAHLSLTQKSWRYLISDPQVWRSIHWRKYLQGLAQGMWTQSFDEFLEDIAIHLEDDPDKIYEMIKAKRRRPKNLAEQYNPYHEPIYFWSFDYHRNHKSIWQKNIVDCVRFTWPHCKSQLKATNIGYGIKQTIDREIKRLIHYDISNPKSMQKNKRARELIDKMILNGDVKLAMCNKAWGLAKGQPPYTPDLIALGEFKTELPAINPPAADFVRLEGMLEGIYGYAQDLDTARTLNDQLAAQCFDIAIERKTAGLTSVEIYGYTPSEPEYVKFIDTLIEKDYRPAIHNKITALANGLFGFVKDQEAAQYLNDQLIACHDLEAIENKIYDLLSDRNNSAGYGKDMVRAYSLIEEMIRVRNVLILKVDSLINGNYGYQRDLVQARQCIEDQLSLNNPHALEFKIMGLINGKFGYEKEPNSIYRFLDILAADDNIYAQYLKSIGLRYGIFGYPHDVPAAKRYIRQHCLPYYLT